MLWGKYGHAEIQNTVVVRHKMSIWYSLYSTWKHLSFRCTQSDSWYTTIVYCVNCRG